MLLELIRTRNVKTVGGCEVSRKALAEAEMAVNRTLGHSGEFIATKEPPMARGAGVMLAVLDGALAKERL
jgi:hypothetical protein